MRISQSNIFNPFPTAMDAPSVTVAMHTKANSTRNKKGELSKRCQQLAQVRGRLRPG